MYDKPHSRLKSDLAPMAAGADYESINRFEKYCS